MRKARLAAAALIDATPLVPVSSAHAQGQDAAAERETDDGDRDFPWGLLGLLGLAGLLGRKRDDRDHVVRHADTDRTTRP